ncbi:integrase core domain-containing protein [Bythopirellula polymerisocia]|uniref:Integrase core domain protein n=1 Tax=Bythopirellula polymerisocia TaxID=2528003 RepID=A0A5C6CES8_9BACT|nr:integrase core domain-containing protein [Bythopirellula polymerisocia]TWU21806.1 Integrase core domain protein [Bythopirellula polymerisocia]
MQQCKKIVIPLIPMWNDKGFHTMTGWFSPFLFFLARCTENELRRQIEFLKAENEMLRQRVPKLRIFLGREERERLLKLGDAIGPGASRLITIVHRRTYQRWVREKALGNPAKKMGRPPTVEPIRQVVIRLARETGWGYRRILGELRKLRIQFVSRTTIKNILKEEGIKPGPRRGSGTWDEFLMAHVDTLWQVDFFSKMVWTPTGLRQAFVLAFIHVGTRRVFCSPCSFKPDAKWMVRQAEAVVERARDAGLMMTYLIRDRDGMYIREFDQVFKDMGCRVKPTAPRAPNQNAFIERWVKSIKFECINYFIVFGKKHLDYIVSSYVEHYNEVRPHQSLGNRPLTGKWPEFDDPLTDSVQIVCHESLGGILRHYERVAA